MKIVWDERKRLINLDRHGMDFATLDEDFFARAAIGPRQQGRKEVAEMTSKWPSFVTKDLGPNDDAEMMRRWEIYDRDMQAIIKAGTAHRDEDGWWVDDATGELIGPDPDIERPLSGREIDLLEQADPLPEVVDALRKHRGPVRTKTAISIRLDDDLVERLRSTGPGWQSRINDALRDWLDRSAA